MEIKCEISNKTEKVEIKIYDYIEKKYGIDTEKIEKQLKEANDKPLDIYINSGGGEVFEGFAIFNILKRYKGYKTVYIDGIAASIASLIALSGNKIIMNKASMFMIHNASSFCFGTAEEMEKTADALRQINKILQDTYKEKSNLTEEQIISFMNQEKFFTPQECLDYGFIDEINDDENIDESQTMTSMNVLKKSIEDRINTMNQLKKVESQYVKNEEEITEEKSTFFNTKNKALKAWLKGEN